MHANSQFGRDGEGIKIHDTVIMIQPGPCHDMEFWHPKSVEM